ncbi:hypothetical protein Cgig2_031989 [Carnegiea gigantea]|uniref:Uncharacterized protein n=1 Tax=Carnegiea gigantea TaxID=171969 RepID=A0A9Q1GXC6_9CARY|nr:hypothetical protein Cgig2_010850 [Carnegiea gigantea]KAJ8426248.1 hypothetical protein Cgig2_031989 [Carnegiea gigantea]
MRLRSLGCCMGRGFGSWKWPSLNCTRELLSRGSGCSVTESMRPGFVRVVREKVQGLVVKGKLQVGERLMVQNDGERESLLSPFTRGAFRDPIIIMAFPPTYSTREMANYVTEIFTWRRRSASRLPRPLPGDFKVLCPHFSLAEAEVAAAESGLLEIVKVTFYAMLLNNMLELRVVHEYTVEKMRSVLVDLGWPAFEAWMRIMDLVIRGAQLYH